MAVAESNKRPLGKNMRCRCIGPSDWLGCVIPHKIWGPSLQVCHKQMGDYQQLNNQTARKREQTPNGTHLKALSQIHDMHAIITQEWIRLDQSLR